MTNTIQIQVRIERKTKYGDYHDALYFTPEEFFDANGSRKLTDEQIEMHAQQRVVNFEANIDEAKLRPPPPEPTDDELFGGLPAEYVTKFEQWVERKKNPPVDSVPGPQPDPIFDPQQPSKMPKVKP